LFKAERQAVPLAAHTCRHSLHSMAVVVKFKYGSDIRRTRASDASFEALQAAARDAYGEVALPGFDLKYADDDGDLCTLTPDTLPDLLLLNEGNSVLVLQFAPKVGTPIVAMPPVSASSSDGGAPAAVSLPTNNADMAGGEEAQADGGQEGRHQQGQHAAWQEHLRKHWTGMMAGSLVHFIPMALAYLVGREAEVDRVVASQPELFASLLRALREGLEPFPQFEEAMSALDRITQSGSLSGTAKVLAAILHALASLPQDQQREVAEVAFGGVAEQLAAVLPTLPCCMPSGCTWWQGPAAQHTDVDEPQAATQEPPTEAQNSCHQSPMLPLFGPWCKGTGKCKGKGKGFWWGRMCAPGGEASSSSSCSSSSSTCSVPRKRRARHERTETTDWKKTRKEAKQRFKEAKQAYKQQKRLWKQQRGMHRLTRAFSSATIAQPEMCCASASEFSEPARPQLQQCEQQQCEQRSPLQILAEMGFDNIELLAQLLERHNNNIGKVVEELLVSSMPDCDSSMQC